MKKLLLLIAMLCCLQVSAGVKGDVNGDNNVDVSDVNLVINKVLDGGGTGKTDVNGDGTTDVSDVNIIINIVLGSDVPKAHEYVDLGLPGGVLWATCNVGAEKPEDFGQYFAWGETVGYAKDERHEFVWKTYKWMVPGQAEFPYVTKYTFEDGQLGGKWYDGATYVGTTVDGVTYKNLKELLPEDDAATANWGPEWRMPSLKEIKDLYSGVYTTNEWVTINGVKGQKVTSKSNGNSIFLPAAGCRYQNVVDEVGVYGYYWTRDIYLHSYEAYCMQFIWAEISFYVTSRCRGVTVRPVCVKTTN